MFSYCLLVANGGWDFLCVACMLCDIILGVTSFIADAHFALWLTEEDRANKAAKVLFTVFVLQWGTMRVISAVSDDSTLGLMSYGAESLLVIFGMVEGVIEWRKGAAIFLMCVACALFIIVY
jgi:hypothetical protein